MKYEAKLVGEIIKNERKKKGWTQEKLAKKLNISSNQISKYEKGELFPPMHSLSRLCEIFNCDLGYILGEDDYSSGSKFNNEIYRVLGLNNDAIQSLKYITGTSKNSLLRGLESDKFKRIVNALFSSPQFAELLVHFLLLDECYEKIKLTSDEFNSFSQSVQDKVFELKSSNYDWEHDEDYLVEDDVKKAYLLFDNLIDSKDSFIFNQKVARYDLREAFELLINDIYPKVKTPM